MVIDNGNHLLLSGNHAALAYLAGDRRRDRLVGPRMPSSPSWISRATSAGRCGSTTGGCRGGFSTSAAACRARSARDYLSLARLLWADQAKTICETVEMHGSAL